MKDRMWLVVLAAAGVVTGLAVIVLLLLWQSQGQESSQQRAAALAVELRVVVCDTGVMELEQFRDEAAQRTNQFITDADRPWTQSARAWDSAVEAAIGEPITIDGYAIQTPLRASGAHRASKTSADWERAWLGVEQYCKKLETTQQWEEVVRLAD
ncbi:MAG: hypothetical protein VYC81_03485 [Actinomycetota bacterium]|nr:hypothetical protein [Actinomycetota bacterium]